MSSTTYPLATVAATITATGITAPDYNDILQSYKASVMSIYGSDVYLEADSQDGQFLAILAQSQFDSNMAAIAAYNAYNPQTALGVALDAAVQVNGIRRAVPSNSTVTLRLIGQAGTTIYGGVASDVLRQLWDLPATVTIPLSGQIDVTATSENPGSIQAQAHSIQNIFTQVAGWQSVDNYAAAVPGAPVESDGQLRQRQKISTSLNARTTNAALRAKVSSLPGVQRAEIYANDTGATDANGVPPHSFTMVVEGGDLNQIALTIARSKDVGSGTAGSTAVATTDPNGNPITIRFEQLVRVPIYVAMDIRPRAGFTDATLATIRSQVQNYINSLGIGEPVYNIWTLAAASNQVDQTYVIVSLYQGTNPGSMAGADIPIAFNQAAHMDDPSQVTISAAL